MPAERLRDARDEWGISQIEFAHREKLRLRERMKKRQQRARMKMEAPPLVPVDNPVQRWVTFRLKGLDVQELGIIAVVTNMTKRRDLMMRGYEPTSVPMSLPWVSFLHGPKAGDAQT